MNFQENTHFSLELEIAVLGGCLLEKSAFGRTYKLIDAECFYHGPHKTVYEALNEMYQSTVPIDLGTVADWIVRKKGINLLNGSNVPYFLTRLTNSVVTCAHLEYWCIIVKQMWMQREIVNLTQSGAPSGDVYENIHLLNAKLKNLQGTTFKKDWYDMSELMIGLIKHQDDMLTNSAAFVETGIKKIDEKNGGFFAGQMIVIGARPSVGKSAFMGQIALNMAARGKRVGIISLEMSNNEIAARLSSINTNIDFNTIFRGLFRDQSDRDRFIQDISTKSAHLPIFVSPDTKLSTVDIRAKAEKMKGSNKLDILFIDYIQLISALQTGNKNRENVVSEISRDCKLMAKDLNIPVVMLCQLNRASTHRKGEERFPGLSDLRESGAIEQDADVVMFIHRDYAVGIEKDENGDSTENKAHILIRKWRNGESNLKLQVGFDGPKMKFIFNDPRYSQLTHVESVALPYADNDKPF